MIFGGFLLQGSSHGGSLGDDSGSIVLDELSKCACQNGVWGQKMNVDVLISWFSLAEAPISWSLNC